MCYRPALRVLRNTFEKCNINTLLLTPDLEIPSLDMGLRARMGLSDAAMLQRQLTGIAPNIAYIITDIFNCNYIALMLPEADNGAVLLIGPYRAAIIEQSDIVTLAERLRLNSAQVRQLESFYSNLPEMTAESQLFALLDAFCEFIWNGGENYAIRYITMDEGADDASRPPIAMPGVKEIERSYACENELAYSIAHGQLENGESLIAQLIPENCENFLNPRVRHLRNRCVALNAIMRKGAENGGVHPFYIDKLSSNFIRRIERISSIAAARKLANEMYRAYCMLVRHHSLKNYSPPVQRVIAAIDADLTADLSLSTLAEMQNINPCYLSSLFKRETDMTITTYVNQKRVEYAATLLMSSKLKIQSIAKQCGIGDVQYFSKMFKKIKGESPKDYRKKRIASSSMKK